MYTYDQGFSLEEVDRMRELEDGLAFEGAVTFRDLDKPSEIMRKSQIAWLNAEKSNTWIYGKISGMVATANNEMWGFALAGFNEAIQYTKYDKVGSHYDWHVDIGKDAASMRKLSLTVMLSDADEYEGGEFEFMLGGQSTDIISSRKGKVLLFPSYMMHRVRPVTKGISRSLVIWISGPPFI